ncbi:hypothetical protein C8F04DRAFT_1259995 [Mycena alexandri]|uniref:Uncharacterized protein n=1 Tax=Mycena alexandri TaxID=1745969 RepID=A0AAD6SY83_9AGAR|nr:hypothetical protein C8F04DRAFT_1259995 [Mycena alexandri]
MILSRTAIFLVCFIPVAFGAVTADSPTGDEKEHPNPVAKKETNADRFRRGLGPLPPTRREHNKFRPRASAVPCTRLSKLQINKASDGEKIGYLSARFNHRHAYTVHPMPAAALKVAVPPVTTFGVAINLVAENPPDSTHMFLGAVDDGQGNIGSGEAGVAILSGTSSVRGNSPPSSSASTSLTLANHGGVESQIWTMNCQSRQVAAQWTNNDNSHPQTTIFYDPVHEFLGLSGDLEAHNAAVSKRAFAVLMTFVPE